MLGSMVVGRTLTFRQVFKRIDKQLPQLTTLDLQYVSPSLLKARNLDLAVPGSFFLFR
jgi:phosphatidylinositol kinase/protein kinase (PI-3  family)